MRTPAAEGRSWVAAALLVACSPASPSESMVGTANPKGVVSGEAPATQDVVTFQWPNVQGGELKSTDLKGRVSVLGFITTYDALSQMQVRFLSKLVREHTPRLNVVIVVLEPPENLPLVQAYGSALDLKVPIVMADAATIRGEGTFSGLHHVPAIAILDRDANERFRNLGLMQTSDLEAAVKRVEADTGVGKK